MSLRTPSSAPAAEPAARWAALAVNVAIVASALALLATLVTGGYRFRLLGVKVHGADIAPPAIWLLVLAFARTTIRQHRFSVRAIADRPAPALFALFLAVYLATGPTPPIGDTFPARYLPFSIYRQGNLDLDEFRFLYAGGTPYFLEVVNGHYVSAYPVAPALLALPVYLPSALGRVRAASEFPLQLEKLTAAIVVALSGVVVYLTLTSLTTRTLALPFALAYAFGSSSLSTSSRALWQHGPSQLALAAAFYCLVRARRDPRWIAGAGFALAFAVICRPTDVLFALPIALYVLVHHTRWAVAFAVGGLPPIAFQLWYNAVYLGNPWRTQFSLADERAWSTPAGEGLLGILLSPARGLLVYSPVFLLSLVALALVWRRGADPLLRYLAVGTVATVLFYSRWTMWWGGHSYGPRLLADLTPALTLLLVPIGGRLGRSRAVRAGFAVLLVWSIGAHAIGAWDDLRWNGSPNIDRVPGRLWSWTDNQLTDGAAEIVDRAVIALRRLPTSRTDPTALAASLAISLEPLPPPTVRGVQRRAVEFTWTAVNVGPAVWLATGGSGQVLLAWRWLGPGHEAVDGELETLRHDVFPGQSYASMVSLDPPRGIPVDRLELGLITVSHGRQNRFATAIVPVAPTGIRAFFERHGAVPDPDPPTRVALRVNASRLAPGDRIRVSLDVRNPRAGAAGDLYVGALFPDGETVTFLGAGRTPTPPVRLTGGGQLVATTTLQPGAVVEDGAFWEFTIPATVTPGGYEVFAVVLRRGGFPATAGAAGDVLGLDVRRVEVSRVEGAHFREKGL